MADAMTPVRLSRPHRQERDHMRPPAVRQLRTQSEGTTCTCLSLPAVNKSEQRQLISIRDRQFGRTGGKEKRRERAINTDLQIVE